MALKSAVKNFGTKLKVLRFPPSFLMYFLEQKEGIKKVQGLNTIMLIYFSPLQIQTTKHTFQVDMTIFNVSQIIEVLRIIVI